MIGTPPGHLGTLCTLPSIPWGPDSDPNPAHSETWDCRQTTTPPPPTPARPGPPTQASSLCQVAATYGGLPPVLPQLRGYPATFTSHPASLPAPLLRAGPGLPSRLPGARTTPGVPLAWLSLGDSRSLWL